MNSVAGAMTRKAYSALPASVLPSGNQVQMTVYESQENTAVSTCAAMNNTCALPCSCARRPAASPPRAIPERKQASMMENA